MPEARLEAVLYVCIHLPVLASDAASAASAAAAAARLSGAEGQAALHRLLSCFCLAAPQLGYCQVRRRVCLLRCVTLIALLVVGRCGQLDLLARCACICILLLAASIGDIGASSHSSAWRRMSLLSCHSWGTARCGVMLLAVMR
jgi:hypothetical protein